MLVTFPALSDYIKMKLFREGQFSKCVVIHYFSVQRGDWGECEKTCGYSVKNN